MAITSFLEVARRLRLLVPLSTEIWSAATSPIATTTNTSVQAAPGAGKYNEVTSLLVTNSHATVGTMVGIYSGAGTRLLWYGYAGPAGGGFSCSFPQVPLRADVNAAITVTCGTAGASVVVSVAGRTKSE